MFARFVALRFVRGTRAVVAEAFLQSYGATVPRPPVSAAPRPPSGDKIARPVGRVLFTCCSFLFVEGSADFEPPSQRDDGVLEKSIFKRSGVPFNKRAGVFGLETTGWPGP